MKQTQETDKKPTGIGFTVVLSPEIMAKLEALAADELRPRAQMARVLIEKALKSK
jgi:predicted transcriptional regulator